MAQPEVRRALTAVGLTTIATETAENRSIANVCLEIHGSLSLEETVALLGSPEKGLARNSRFRSRVVGGTFVEIPGFDVASVITPFEIPEEPATHERWMLDYIGVSGTDPLNGGDEELPLWECRVIQGYKGSVTLLHFRFHHCMMDGASLMMLLFGLVDEAPQLGLSHVGSETRAATEKPKGRGSLRALIRLLIILLVLLATYALLNFGLRGLLLTLLLAAFASFPSVVLFAVSSVPVLVKHARALFRSKAGSPLKGTLGVQKSLAIGSTWYDIGDLKAAAKKHGKFTINDLMLAAFVGSLRRWIEKSRGQAAVKPGTSITCAMPVDLRKRGELYIGNKIGAFTIELPVGEADRQKRLKKVAAEATRGKTSPEASLGFLLGKAALVLPAWGSKMLMGKMTSGVECVFSNVKGLDIDTHVAGKKFNFAMGFVPPPPGVSLGLACGSVGGRMNVSLSADKTLLGERTSSEVLAEFEDELAALMGAVQP